MAQDTENTESTSRDRQPELEAGFLDWLGSFQDKGTSIDDLSASLVPVVEAAKDPNEQG